MITAIPPCSSPRIQAAKLRLAAQTSAIAVVAAAALTPTAEAFGSEIVFTPETPVVSSSSGFVSFDPYSLFTVGNYNGALIGLRACGVYIAFNTNNIQFLSLAPTIYPWDGTNTPYTLPTLLSAGTTVGAGGTYSAQSFAANSDGSYFDVYGPDRSDIYLGYRIVSGTTSGGYDYGWVRFDIEPVNALITLHQWAIRTDGQGIVVPSAIPEPSAFAAITGVALLGFAATRRRRRAG